MSPSIPRTPHRLVPMAIRLFIDTPPTPRAHRIGTNPQRHHSHSTSSPSAQIRKAMRGVEKDAVYNRGKRDSFSSRACTAIPERYLEGIKIPWSSRCRYCLYSHHESTRHPSHVTKAPKGLANSACKESRHGRLSQINAR